MPDSKGRLFGRLFAQLEHAGVVHLRDYELACESPVTIVPAFSKLARAGNMDAIAEVMAALPADAFNEQVMSPSDQADFPLGYWQEKARIVRTYEEPISEEEQYTASLLVRLEPSLKKWTLEHGGSDMVRRLLRKEMARLSS